jgi:hypothetical protein
MTPLELVNRNEGAGADTFANSSSSTGNADELLVEDLRENLVSSELMSSQMAATNLLSLSGLVDYSSKIGEQTILELSRHAVATVVYDANLLWSQLDEVEASFEAQFGDVSVTLGAVSAFGAAGYILWTLRGGVLMAAAMSQLPGWRMVDPLPLLDSYAKERIENADDDVIGFFD